MKRYLTLQFPCRLIKAPVMDILTPVPATRVTADVGSPTLLILILKETACLFVKGTWFSQYPSFSYRMRSVGWTGDLLWQAVPDLADARHPLFPWKIWDPDGFEFLLECRHSQLSACNGMQDNLMMKHWRDRCRFSNDGGKPVLQCLPYSRPFAVSLTFTPGSVLKVIGTRATRASQQYRDILTVGRQRGQDCWQNSHVFFWI